MFELFNIRIFKWDSDYTRPIDIFTANLLMMRYEIQKNLTKVNQNCVICSWWIGQPDTAVWWFYVSENNSHNTTRKSSPFHNLFIHLLFPCGQSTIDNCPKSVICLKSLVSSRYENVNEIVACFSCDYQFLKVETSDSLL